MKYKLVYASDLRKLQNDVNAYLSFGFKLVGGASSNGRVYAQAMTTDGDVLDLGTLKREREMKEIEAKKKEAAKAKKAKAAEAESEEAESPSPEEAEEE